MKRIVLTLLLAGMLTVMAACGGMNGEDMANAGNRVDDVETPAQRSGRAAMGGEDRLDRTADDIMDDVEETLDGSDWDEMIRNGKVRDTDGDLKDGENALHGRYGDVR